MAFRLAKRPKQIKFSKPIISFSFDDFPQSALTVGGEILLRYGVEGTYYVSLGLMDTNQPTGRMFSRADLQQLVREGHELGCHTFAHCDAWQTAPSIFEASILENGRALENFFSSTEFGTHSIKFKTHSYPINSPRPKTKRLAAKYFDCCRGGGQKNNSGLADLNNLGAFFLEQNPNAQAISQIIAKNQRERGWLIFATHDLSQNPTRFGCTPSFFESVVREAVNSGALILPVFKAFQQLNNRI